jgi:hypothetical protein
LDLLADGAASNRASSKGLLKKQTAPAFIACSLTRSCGKAVMKMIDVLWLLAVKWSWSSMPLMPGICTSVDARRFAQLRRRQEFLCRSVDPANAVARRDGEDLLKETREKGIGATTQSYLKGSHVVRAFNSMSYSNFVKEAHRAGDPMAIPIAGDDARAVQVTSQLVRDAGFEPVAVPLARAQEFASAFGILAELTNALLG